MDQKKIGEFIAENRKKQNMTQEQLATRIGVSKNAISKWERGLNLPDASKMQDLCSILNISLNEFFAGEYIKAEEIEKQSENNILNIVKAEYRRKIRYRIITTIFVSIIILSAIFITRSILIQSGHLPNPALKYTQRYEEDKNNLHGNVDYSKFETISMDFEIGANKYGYAVFKNPSKAYRRLKKDFSIGLKAIQREYDLAPLNIFNFGAYETYGWSLPQGTQEEKEQAAFITQFFDIYENSLN